MPRKAAQTAHSLVHIQMHALMLDGNVFDRLAVDDATREQVSRACEAGLVRILISPVVQRELEASPFGRVPDFFPFEIVVESVAVAGLAIAGLAIPGEGKVFSKHLGNSKKGADAVIADSASAYADILVSEDARCISRLREIGGSCACLSYAEFQSWLAEVG